MSLLDSAELKIDGVSWISGRNKPGMWLIRERRPRADFVTNELIAAVEDFLFNPRARLSRYVKPCRQSLKDRYAI